MSTNKRRKIDGQPAPPSPASAVSAIAARRRLAASVEPAAAAADDDDDDEPDIRESSNSNAFSLLRNLSRHGNTPDSTRTDGYDPRRSKKKGNQTNSESIELDNDEALTEILSSKVVQYSSLRPNKRNYRERNDGVIELRLDESERFLILGSFGIRILQGQAVVAGATLRPSENLQWIHAPHCHAIPVLRTKEHTRLEIHKDGNGLALRQLGRLSPLMKKIWHEPLDDDSRKSQSRRESFNILYSAEDAPKRGVIQDLVSPPAWNRKLASLVASSAQGEKMIVMVCGPKSSGKSTFSRILTNRLLTMTKMQSEGIPNESSSVMVLDLDPGQPEYALPGTLSLVEVNKPNLSPPFIRGSFGNSAYRVVRSHAFASVSPASDPELYRECLRDLYKTCHTGFGGRTLLINTAGWIQGTGLELLEDIIKETSPSEVVYMSEDGPGETIEALQEAITTAFTELPSQQSEFTTRTAAHLRAMQTMSYFHSKANSENLGWNSSPISTLRPWQVRYSGARSGILGILSYDYQSPAELLAETVSGMVLALIEIEDSRAFRALCGFASSDGSLAKQPPISRSPEGLPIIANPKDIALDPRYSRALGLALVRGIDSETQSLQLLTPTPIQQIEEVKKLGRDIVLVHGKFDAPSWAYTEDLYYRNSNDDAADQAMKIEDEDTSEDNSDVEPENVNDANDVSATPWVEVLKGNEKRPVGSKVWRVRRDLGRNPGEG